MMQKRSTPPPPGSVRCSVCKNFAWNDVGQHAVKSGGAWHHPSCPQVDARRKTFLVCSVKPARSAIERMLILFRGHVDVTGAVFYVLGLATVAVAVQSFFVACG